MKRIDKILIAALIMLLMAVSATAYCNRPEVKITLDPEKGQFVANVPVKITGTNSERIGKEPTFLWKDQVLNQTLSDKLGFTHRFPSGEHNVSLRIENECGQDTYYTGVFYVPENPVPDLNVTVVYKNSAGQEIHPDTDGTIRVPLHAFLFLKYRNMNKEREKKDDETNISINSDNPVETSFNQWDGTGKILIMNSGTLLLKATDQANQSAWYVYTAIVDRIEYLELTVPDTIWEGQTSEISAKYPSDKDHCQYKWLFTNMLTGETKESEGKKISPSFSDPGIYNATLNVVYKGSLLASKSAEFDVDEAVNDAPKVFWIRIDKKVVRKGDPMNITFRVFDDRSEIYGVKVTIVDDYSNKERSFKDRSVSLDRNNTGHVVYIPEITGTHTVKIEACDKGGECGSNETDFKVYEQSQPTPTPPDEEEANENTTHVGINATKQSKPKESPFIEPILILAVLIVAKIIAKRR